MDIVDYENFSSLDIRVGSITEVKDFKRARSPSYKVQVDLGDGDLRWSSAQITSYHQAELIGRQVICVTNLAPRNIAGFMSEVLILGVPDIQNNTILLTPEKSVENGVPVF